MECQGTLCAAPLPPKTVRRRAATLAGRGFCQILDGHPACQPAAAGRRKGASSTHHSWCGFKRSETLRPAPPTLPGLRPPASCPPAGLASPNMGAFSHLVTLSLVGVVAALCLPPRVAAQETPVHCDIDFDGNPLTYDLCEQLAGPVNVTILWSINATSLSGAFRSNFPRWVALAFPGDGTSMVAPAPPPVVAVVGMATVGPTPGPELPSSGVYPLLARKSSGVQPLGAAAAAAAGYTGCGRRSGLRTALCQ